MVGLMAFTDRVEKVIPPGRGNRHVMQMIMDILTFEPQGRGTSITGALEYLSRLQKRRSIIFLISDFYDENYKQALTAASGVIPKAEKRGFLTAGVPGPAGTGPPCMPGGRRNWPL